MGVIMSMGGQALHFGISVLAGAFIGVLYDCFRVARRVSRPSGFAVQLQDALFWLASTVLLFVFMHHMGMGQLRFFIVVGAVVGAALYFATLSRVILRPATVAVQFLRRIIIVSIRIIFLPFTWALEKLRPLIIYCLRILKRCVTIQRKKLAHSWHAMRKKV
jgi:spore cortex biosynthesis protein YabQ